jgi:hypothetical protein
VDPEADYSVALQRLADTRPRLARALQQAERLRTDRLRLYLPGKRLAGLEQLLRYLDALSKAYVSSGDLAKLVFLLQRVASDFETALEATLSGYQGVAADAMRDVMETEYLLLDFATHPDHADEWLSSDRDARLRKFAPSKLRKRLIDAGIPPFSDDGWEPVDYRAHSESLHVSPQIPLVGARGIEPHPDGSMLSDAGFIEMFEHGWRFIQAAELLRFVHAGEPADLLQLAPLDEFFDSRDRTREMLVIVVATLEGPSLLREKLGGEPTTAELLGHVKTELLTKSPRAE